MIVRDGLLIQFGNASDTSGIMRKRYDLKTEAKLAFLPTVMMGIVLIVMNRFAHGQVFFTSLASSAFLVYLDPRHPANSVRTLFLAQLSAVLIGILMLKLIGPGHIAALIAMACIIIFMLVFNMMHPPAVSTALSVGFVTGSVLPLFLIALILLVLLIIVQKLMLDFLDGKQKKRIT